MSIKKKGCLIPILVAGSVGLMGCSTTKPEAKASNEAVEAVSSSQARPESKVTTDQVVSTEEPSAKTLANSPVTSKVEPVVSGKTPSTNQDDQPIVIKENQEIDLAYALKVALINNPTIDSMRYSVAKAKAVESVASSHNSFRLDFNGSATSYSDAQRVVPATRNNEKGDFSQNIFGAELILSYPLYTGGALSANEDAARYSTNAVHYQLQRAKQELVFNVSRTFATILAQEKLIESLEFNLKSLATHLEHINNLIAAQKGTKLDRLRVEVRISNIKQKLTRSENQYKISLEVLSNLMGVEGYNFRVKGELAPKGTDHRQQVVVLLAKAISYRNDIAAMDEQLNAQRKKIEAADAGYSPTVSAFGAYGARWGVSPSGEGDVGRVGINLNFPIWDGDNTAANVDREEAELSRLLKQKEALIQNIRLQVQTAALNLESALSRIEATQKAVDQAHEVFRMQQEAEKLGKATLSDLLDAQTELLTSQTDYYAALAEEAIAEAEIKLATGQKENTNEVK